MPNKSHSRIVTLLNPGGRESRNMAKHGKGHSARRNPPEGGYAKSIGMLAVGSLVAGAASYGAAWLVGMTEQSEMVQDLILSLGGIALGGAIGLMGTPSRNRQLLGSAVAFGPVAVASSRYIAYLRATPEQRTVVDAARTAGRAAPQAVIPGGYPYATIPGGAPVSGNAYMGLGAGSPEGWWGTIPSGAPVSGNAYRGWGAQ